MDILAADGSYWNIRLRISVDPYQLSMWKNLIGRCKLTNLSNQLAAVL
jgi:hypothetical protein